MASTECALIFPYHTNFTEDRIRGNFIELERWVDNIARGACCVPCGTKCRLNVPHLNNFTDSRLRANFIALSRWSARWGSCSGGGGPTSKCMYHFPFSTDFNEHRLKELWAGIERWADGFIRNCCALSCSDLICKTVDLDVVSSTYDGWGPAGTRAAFDGSSLWGVIRNAGSGLIYIAEWDYDGNLLTTAAHSGTLGGMGAGTQLCGYGSDVFILDHGSVFATSTLWKMSSGGTPTSVATFNVNSLFGLTFLNTLTMSADATYVNIWLSQSFGSNFKLIRVTKSSGAVNTFTTSTSVGGVNIGWTIPNSEEFFGNTSTGEWHFDDARMTGSNWDAAGGLTTTGTNRVWIPDANTESSRYYLWSSAGTDTPADRMYQSRLIPQTTVETDQLDECLDPDVWTTVNPTISPHIGWGIQYSQAYGNWFWVWGQGSGCAAIL